MNARERFFAMFRGGRVDRPFLWESVFLQEAVERWRREGLAADADAYAYLGFDRLARGGINIGFDPPLSGRIIADEGASELVEDEVGGVLRQLKNPTSWGGTTTWVQYRLRDRASWRLLKQRMDPNSPRRLRAWQGLVEALPSEPSIHGHSDGFSGSCAIEDGLPTLLTVQGPTYWLIETAGFSHAAVMLYDEPELVEEVYEHFTWLVTCQMEAVFARRVPDAVFIDEEGGVTGGPFMSPQMYRALVVPKLRQIAELCISAGVVLVFVESGGDVSLLVPLWKEAGINGILPLDVGAGVDPIAMRREHRDLALIGGIDRRVLPTSREQIQRQITEHVRVLLREGGCIPSVDAHGAVGADVSFDNIRFYADALRKEAEQAMGAN